MFDRKKYHRIYMRKWWRENKDKHYGYVKNWRKRNPEKYKAKKYKAMRKKIVDKSRFNGMLETILKRDNHECQICGQKHTLYIHHFNKDRKDNSYWNLLTLCPSCHKIAHNGFL